MRHTLLFFFISLSATAQIGFAPKAVYSPIGQAAAGGSRSGIPVAVIDMNGDGLDDMIVLDKAKHLRIYLQCINSEEFYSAVGFYQVNLDQFALAVGNLDNEGSREIIIGGIYDGLKILQEMDGGVFWKQIRDTRATFFTQNISMVDLNNDGYLDIFVNDDDASPIFFMNNSWQWDDRISVDQIPNIFGKEGETSAGNYGSIWTDFDLDGDLDLYISKCRLGVSNPSDPRRVNQLFTNEEGEFIELADSFGLDIGEQTWVTDFVDLDNDLDLDIVMIHHTGGNEIYENLGGGVYEKRIISEEWSEVFEGLQVIGRDFDNDGLKDILITGVESKMFWNKGQFKFELDQQVFGPKTITSGAVGDLNNDGFLDIYAGYADNIVRANPYFDDEIWYNKTNENNYLTVTLVGTAVNRDAVGAKVYASSANLQQFYEIRSGSSYGIRNSANVILGLGSDTIVTELKVLWPNGDTIIYQDVLPNRKITITQDGCLTDQVSVEFPEGKVVCPAEGVILSVQGDYDIEWSNRKRDTSILVVGGGRYDVTVTDEDGCSARSGMIHLQHVNYADKKPKLEIVSPEKAYCQGELVTLRSFNNPIFSSNQFKDSIFSVQAEEEVRTTALVCNETHYADPLMIPLLRVDTPIYEIMYIPENESGTFTAEGENVSWYVDSLLTEFIGEGPQVIVNNVINDTSLFAISSQRFINRDTLRVPFDSNDLYYPSDIINGGLVFSVANHKITLKSITTTTEMSGIRNFQIKSYWGEVLFEQSVFVEGGTNKVVLDFELPPSPYYLLTTDEQVNLQNFGTRSPQFQSIQSQQFLFPIRTLDNNVRIISSTGSEQTYYSFFNWEVEAFDKTCSSVPVKVTLKVQRESNTIDMITDRLKVYPNPVADILYFDVDKKYHSVQVSVYDINGKVVYSETNNEGKLDLYHLHTGLYLLKVEDKWIRFVKI